MIEKVYDPKDGDWMTYDGIRCTFSNGIFEYWYRERWDFEVMRWIVYGAEYYVDGEKVNKELPPFFAEDIKGVKLTNN